MKEIEKVEMLIDLFASIFTGKVHSQAHWVTEPCDRGCGNETLPRAMAERDREYLSKLRIQNIPMGANVVLTELTKVDVRLLLLKRLQ